MNGFKNVFDRPVIENGRMVDRDASKDYANTLGKESVCLAALPSMAPSPWHSVFCHGPCVLISGESIKQPRSQNTQIGFINVVPKLQQITSPIVGLCRFVLSLSLRGC
eukprot:755700-Amphidinium_carterae.1